MCVCTHIYVYVHVSGRAGGAEAAVSDLPLRPRYTRVQDEDEVEAMGDVDLFSLTPCGTALAVNPRWLTHLEERLLGEDGHPRKARPAEDPHRCGEPSHHTAPHHRREGGRQFVLCTAAAALI